MKWMVIVVFATMSGDFYVFTNPKFDSKQECMEQLKDPTNVFKMVMKIGEAYGRPMPVHLVNCLNEEEIDDILKNMTVKETDNETNV